MISNYIDETIFTEFCLKIENKIKAKSSKKAKEKLQIKQKHWKQTQGYTNRFVSFIKSIQNWLNGEKGKNKD